MSKLFACAALTLCLTTPFGAQAAKPQAKASAVEKVLFVKLKAKPGKEAEAAKFLTEALPLVQQEPGTALWFAVKFDDGTFAIFDAAADEAGRQAHLAGKVAAALMARAKELFADAPNVEKADILAKKVNKG